jgi:hypothetical protein
MCWRNDRFIYEDPLEIVLWSHVDGLDGEDFMMDLEDRFEVELPSVDDVCLQYRFYGELVDAILAQLGSASR